MTPIFYTLKQLETYEFTDLRYRMIKYRFKELLKSSKIEEGELVKKAKNRWYVHISLIDKFQPKRKLKTHKKIHYQNELTINFDDNYDADFYHLIGSSILRALDPHKSIYRIESGMVKDTYHIHFGTTAGFEEIHQILSLLEDELDLIIINNKNTHVSKICNLALFMNYINKAFIYSLDKR